MAVTAFPPPSQTSKPRWGELDDEEEEFEFLPPPVVVGPDENGLKKKIVYTVNEDGKKVKVTTTSRTTTRCLSKSAVERRSWSKFGDAAQTDAGSRLTMVSTEVILLERPKGSGAQAEDPRANSDLSAIVKQGAVLMVCRTCGKKGDHWTSRCPYKDLVMQSDSSDRPDAAVAASSEIKKGSYVPPSMRAGADRSTMPDRRRSDENSVRVTNLSEDTREDDLRELFQRIGPVTRVYIATDRKTELSRGFGFVSFVHREDGERAVNKLNGYGYDNLILRVEWAAPRAN